MDYIKALDTGHQYQLSLYPATCDLSESIIRQNLALTDQTKLSLPAFSIHIQKIAPRHYTMNLILKGDLLQKTSLDLTLYNLNATSYVPKIFIPDAMLLALAQYTTGAKLAVTSYLGATFPGTVILHVTSAVWSLVSFQQFVSYFMFINMQYPFQVNLFFTFTQPQGWDFIPNPLASLTKAISHKFPGFINDTLEEKNRPQKFIDEDKSSSFIDNGGAIIALNIEILLVLGLITLLRKIPFLSRNRVIKSIYESLRWNIVIRTFLENGTPLVFAIFLQSRVLSLDGTYHYLVLSLILLSSVYAIITMAFSVKILSKKSIADLKSEAAEKEYGTLYKDIELTNDASKYYYIITLVRGIVINFLVTFVDSLPLMQVVVLIFYNMFFVWYLFKRVVLKSRALIIIYRINQILILGAEIFILCLAFETRYNLYYSILGWMISGSLLSALLLELGYLIVVQVIKIKGVWLKAKQLWKKIRDRNSKKKPKARQLRRRPVNRRTRVVDVSAIEPIITIPR